MWKLFGRNFPLVGRAWKKKMVVIYFEYLVLYCYFCKAVVRQMVATDVLHIYQEICFFGSNLRLNTRLTKSCEFSYTYICTSHGWHRDPPLVKSHEQLKSEAETYTRYGPWLPENNYGRWKLVKTSTFSARTYLLRIIMHIFDNFTFSNLSVEHLIATSWVHPELPVTSWMPKDAQANVGRWSKYFHALARGLRFRASKNFILEDWWR